MKNKKAFTLIELVSVLVILAILALIVTPLVLNIIRKARTAADKRSIDAYGRSIELAIADYLLDNGTFPTSIDQLTIEYSGDRVVCETTQLNSDSSIYLAECTVNNREITGYTYGTDKTEHVTYNAYEVGETIEYNGISYYVIKNSNTSEQAVTLLKAEPLSYENESIYFSGQGVSANISGQTNYGPTSDYSTSYIKTIVDAWATANVPEGLKEARLITIDEITSLGYEWIDNGSAAFWQVTEDAPNWVDNNYWTMSQYNDSSSYVWTVSGNGYLGNGAVNYGRYCVRPVIVLSKSVLN